MDLLLRSLRASLDQGPLASVFVLATTASAQNDGQWHPSGYAAGGAAVSPTVQTWPLDTTAPTPSMPVVKTTKQTGVVVASAAGTATAKAATGTTDSWESQVTWPAGCEPWANPCPPGAKISGGGVAGYTNGFTSYTTETDSNGVITGMPTKATIAAGVSEAAQPTTMSTISAASNATLATSSRSPTRSSSGFSVQTQSASGATANAAFTASGLIIVGAVMAFLC